MQLKINDIHRVGLNIYLKCSMSNLVIEGHSEMDE